MNLNKGILSHLLLLFTWVSLLTYIGSKTYGVFYAVLQSIFIILWSYFGHIFAHYISSGFPMNYINPHILIHHNKSFDIPRWLDLFIEAITNASSFLILIVIQHYLDIHILSTSIILFGAFLYVVIHIFDYSIFGDEEHALHHQFTFCNYSPKTMDILFNTRCDKESEYKPVTQEFIYTLSNKIWFCRYNKIN